MNRRQYEDRTRSRGARGAKDPKRPAGTDSATPPRRVRKVKNAQGTRVSRAVTCAACGAEDRVEFVPRAGQPVLCRACAADKLGVEDRDAGFISQETRRCPDCGRTMTVARDAPEDFVCNDCHRGISVPDRSRLAKAEPTGRRGALRIRRERGTR